MDLPTHILHKLNETSTPLESLDLASTSKEDHQKIVGAIKSLESLGDVIKATIVTKKSWELTIEGREVVKHGSHEAVTFNAVPRDGISQAELLKSVKPWGQIGFSKAMSAGWIAIDKSGGKPIVRRKVDAIEDTVADHLKLIQAGQLSKVPEKERNEYKKRKLLQESTMKCYLIEKGDNFTLNVEKPETELTPELMTSGKWKSTKFKAYNFDSLGIAPPAGHLHPLMKVRAEFRQIFLEMGFTEMPTNNYVESSFWNFDALFQPQQHPARDAHDTFFLSDPALATDFPKDYLERVKTVHSRGGYGSQGYGYDWKLEEAQKNLLRTHTTAVSARVLYQLAQTNEGKDENGKFRPKKFFSIDRVFRNETLDATHLAEFHQIEGVVAMEGLTLGHLIGLLYEFFSKLGIHKLRFKPAYNPYTEPSMEVFSYHEGLKKWVEIGNSGLFRPEMLLPMGLPKGVNVAGYGLSLERPTMIKYGIDNIRELCGNRVNLKMVYENPICRLDKNIHDPRETLMSVTERRWDVISRKLDHLKDKLNSLKSSVKFPIVSAQEIASSSRDQTPSRGKFCPKSIVIFISPDRPPFFIRKMLDLLTKQRKKLLVQTHVHSSLEEKLPQQLVDFFDKSKDSEVDPSNADMSFSLIWKERKPRDTQPTLSLLKGARAVKISGEDNIARYFSRLLPDVLPYDNLSPSESAFIDEQMRAILNDQSDHSKSLISKMEQTLVKSNWISGKEFSIADLLLWSTLQQAKKMPNLPQKLATWLSKCSKA